jgi:AcrR family transcriptional regulator
MGITERKRKEKQARIDLIKKNARFLFQKGFEATKMEDIASRAEISKATIYQYFKSKNDLFYDIMQERLTNLNNAFVEICGRQEDPETTMMLISDRMLDFSIEESDIYHLVTTLKITEIKKLLSPDKAGHLREIMASNLRQVELVIRGGIDSGVFRRIDAKVVAIIFWNMFMGIIQFQENRLDVGKKDYRKSTLEAANELIMAGLKKK